MAQLQQFITGISDDPRTLVVVFLRGGADGLNMVAPLEDDGYFRARCRIAIRKEKAIALDGFFGLNPLLGPLALPYRDGALAIIHAVGSEDDTRSHFEAQDLMERGGLSSSGGWLGRFLRALPHGSTAPLAAVAVGTSIPESLRGAPACTVMDSLESFRLGAKSPQFAAALGRLWTREPAPLGPAGRDSLRALDRIEQLSRKPYSPDLNAHYPQNSLARALREVARLIKGRVGLVAASIDLDGWDSHITQGAIMDPLMEQLAGGLAAFYRDLGKLIETTTVVIMTEFGRRVYENASFGTDHGRGSVMFILGGGVRGGRVIARWPTLNREILEGPGDLPVTTNYRNV
ncbi:MAG: DUF1501 domain-containing protein, partial [Verrucomicrobia subdivision 3 bacterium]|nr:DUF1501 domain-containing protein [Limisphaerales bacterium]